MFSDNVSVGEALFYSALFFLSAPALLPD